MTSEEKRKKTNKRSTLEANPQMGLIEKMDEMFLFGMDEDEMNNEPTLTPCPKVISHKKSLKKKKSKSNNVKSKPGDSSSSESSCQDLPEEIILNDDHENITEEVQICNIPKDFEEENRRLLKLISEYENEIKTLKKKAEEQSLILVNKLGCDLAANKIIELSRRIRELTAELESEKTKVRQLTKKTKDLENQLSQALLNPNKSKEDGDKKESGQGDANEDNSQDVVKTLQERLNKEVNKVNEYRNQCISLKQDLKLAHKALSKEVGEGANIQALVSETNSWRGRAQQILTLQKKVSDLKLQLDLKSNSEIQSDSTKINSSQESPVKNVDDKNRKEIKRLEKEQKEAQEKALADHRSLEEEHNQLKSRFEALKSRNKILGSEIQMQKMQVETLMQKGKHDDELITYLVNQQSHLRKILDDNQQLIEEKKSRHIIQVQQEKQKSLQEVDMLEQMKNVIVEKDALIQQMQQELKNREVQTMHHCDSPPRSNLESTDVNISLEDLQLQYQEIRILHQTSEIEREKFSELIAVLQKRINDANIKVIDAKKNLEMQCQKNIHLEKLLHKNKPDPDKNSKTPKKIPFKLSDGTSVPCLKPEDIAINELQANLAIQKDENESLKSALDSTLKAKEDDMRLYQAIMEQTRSMFLQELKKIQQTPTV